MTLKQQEKGHQEIALMLGLKPVQNHKGAYQTIEQTDTKFRFFFNDILEGESWYEYPKWDIDYNWQMQVIDFIENKGYHVEFWKRNNFYHCGIASSESIGIEFDITKAKNKDRNKCIFEALIEFATLYNEKSFLLRKLFY